MTTATKPMSHSHSRLVTFSACPLSYRLTYIDKVPAESSDAMEIGAAAHEFFDQWVKLYGGEGKNGSIYMKRVGSEVVETSKEETILSLASQCFQKEARSQDNFKEFLEICQIFAKSYKPDPAYPVVQAERQVAFKKHWIPCDWMDPEVMFRAKIDMIESPAMGEIVKKIRITDWKTGYAGAMNSFQLDVYAFVSKLLYAHLEQVEVQFFYTKSGFKQVKLLEVKDMDITKVQLEALMERIEGETKWKAKPGARCLNCSVAAHCTEKPSNLIALTKIDQAQAVAAEIAFLEAQAKAKKKGLKAWCEKEGAVESGGLTWNNWPKESMKIEIAPLLSTCVSYQIDPGEILNPDSRAVKKAIKNNPGFGEAISPYVTMETSTAFSAKKTEADND